MTIILIAIIGTVLLSMGIYADTMGYVSDDYALWLLWNYKQEITSLKALHKADPSQTNFVTTQTERINNELKRFIHHIRLQYPIALFKDIKDIKWAADDISNETQSFLASLKSN